MPVTFDTLAYSERAQVAGFTKKQADFQAHEIGKLIKDELVTKSYFKEHLDSRLKDLTIRLGAMMMTGFGLTIMVLGFLVKTH